MPSTNKQPIYLLMSRSIADALGLPVIVPNADGSPTAVNIDKTILVCSDYKNETWHEWPIVAENEQA